MCSTCGNEVYRGAKKCTFCAVEDSTQQLRNAAPQGPIASHTAEAEAKRYWQTCSLWARMETFLCSASLRRCATGRISPA